MAWIRKHLLFVVCVAIPTLSAILYFGLIATDVYVSESEFVVSGSGSSAPSGGIASLLLGGASHAHGDSSEVKDYILSRDALRELGNKFRLREIYGHSGINFIDRYPGIIYDRSFEELYKYYLRHVEVEMDSSSSIVTLSVRAFSAEDARKINSELLDMSERLINTLNERSRQDLIKFADSEVKIASENSKNAALALFNYRSHQTVFEPNKQASLQLETVGKINQELISTEAEIAEIKKLSPDNPQIDGLESSADMLRRTITAETSKVTSPTGSFSARAPEYERLQLEVEFADKQLGAALEELENARADAQKKQTYLERLTQPSVQDKSMEPKRIRSILTAFAVSLLVWGIAGILAASIREHAE